MVVILSDKNTKNREPSQGITEMFCQGKDSKTSTRYPVQIWTKIGSQKGLESKFKGFVEREVSPSRLNEEIVSDRMYTQH